MIAEAHTEDTTTHARTQPQRELGQTLTSHIPDDAWCATSELYKPTGSRVRAVSADAAAWHIIRSRSRQEKLIAEFLDNNSIGFFIPMVRTERTYGHRLRITDSPLFNGYVFLFGTRDDTFKLLGTKRATQVIPVPNQVRFASELDSIRRALEAGQTLELFPGLKSGTAVRVTTGTMAGVIGVVIDESRPGWLHLQVDMLGQAACIEVNPAALEVIDPEIAANTPHVDASATIGGLETGVRAADKK